MSDSEQLLAQALRAQAAAGGTEPVMATLPVARVARRRLAAGWLLVIALVLGLVAGAAAGLVTAL